jgi:hypothetical protein
MHLDELEIINDPEAMINRQRKIEISQPYNQRGQHQRQQRSGNQDHKQC